MGNGASLGRKNLPVGSSISSWAVASAILDDIASALRIGPLASIGPVYWNGTHLSVFEFRVEKKRDHDFDAAGASV
jgi:hypothetical protein